MNILFTKKYVRLKTYKYIDKISWSVCCYGINGGDMRHHLILAWKLKKEATTPNKIKNSRRKQNSNNHMYTKAIMAADFDIVCMYRNRRQMCAHSVCHLFSSIFGYSWYVQMLHGKSGGSHRWCRTEVWYIKCVMT